MVFQVVDPDEEVPYGELVRCSLSTLSNEKDSWIPVVYNGKNVPVYRQALVAKETETPEETSFILELYRKLCQNDKIVILNIDPAILGCQVGGDGGVYYAGWLTSGEDYGKLRYSDEAVRANFYLIFREMLIDDDREFVEVVIEKSGNTLVYSAKHHLDGKLIPIDSIPFDSDYYQLTSFFNSLVK